MSLLSIYWNTLIPYSIRNQLIDSHDTPIYVQFLFHVQLLFLIFSLSVQLQFLLYGVSTVRGTSDDILHLYHLFRFIRTISHSLIIYILVYFDYNIPLVYQTQQCSCLNAMKAKELNNQIDPREHPEQVTLEPPTVSITSDIGTTNCFNHFHVMTDDPEVNSREVNTF